MGDFYFIILQGYIVYQVVLCAYESEEKKGRYPEIKEMADEAVAFSS